MSRLLGFIVVLLTGFFIFTSTIQASAGLPSYPVQENSNITLPQTTNGSFDYQQDQNNLSEYSQSVIIQILSSIICNLGGTNPLDSTRGCLGINPNQDNSLSYTKEPSGGAIAFVGGLIADTYSIPISSSQYFSIMASRFGIVQPALAEHEERLCEQFELKPDRYNECLDYARSQHESLGLGYGFNSLRPVLRLWEMFRNIMFLFIVIIFVVAGLGIMFRINISPKSVMTIQGILPRIVTGLILITFSYAIAGFLVDVMYVTLYLLYELLSSQLRNGAGTALNPASLHGTSPIGAIGGISGTHDIASSVAGDFGPILGSLLDNKFGSILATIIGAIAGGGVGLIGGGIAAPIGAVVGAAIGGFMGAKLIGFVGGLFAYIIILIAVLWAMIRLWWILIKSYISILIDVVFAPFWIGIGLLPGSSAGFGRWFRNLVANLAAFPTAMVFFLLGRIFVDAFERPVPGAFTPPLIGNPTGPENFASIIGLGIILMLPEVVGAFKGILKAQGFSYGKAISENIGVGRTAATILPSKWWSRQWRHYDPLTGRNEGRLRALFAGKGVQKTPADALPINPTWRQKAALNVKNSFNKRRYEFFGSNFKDRGGGGH